MGEHQCPVEDQRVVSMQLEMNQQSVSGTVWSVLQMQLITLLSTEQRMLGRTGGGREMPDAQNLAQFDECGSQLLQVVHCIPGQLLPTQPLVRLHTVKLEASLISLTSLTS